MRRIMTRIPDVRSLYVCSIVQLIALLLLFSSKQDVIVVDGFTTSAKVLRPLSTSTSSWSSEGRVSSITKPLLLSKIQSRNELIHYSHQNYRYYRNNSSNNKVIGLTAHPVSRTTISNEQENTKNSNFSVYSSTISVLRRMIPSKYNKPKKKIFLACMLFVQILTVVSFITTTPPAYAAIAAKKTTVAAVHGGAEHLHTGQKIANFFRGTMGLSDLAILTIISALPVVELRGAIPVGIWMGLPITTVLPVCVLGNMIPILPILLTLRNKTIMKLMKPILNRAEAKTSELGIGNRNKQWISLAAFVGVPLPGTGAWTGAMGAFLLGMPIFDAMTSIFSGVFAAGLIMSAITLAGKKGGIAALAVLLGVTAQELLRKDDTKKKQDFLEADPYWDQSNVLVNTYKNKEPFVGKVVSTKRIVGPKATGETCHIIIDHGGKFPYWEGQSWGVIPPGTREKDGKPHSVRLYSIASTRYGDDMTGKTGSLCVRRATYWCPELKADDPAKKGICSNFLCDTKTGDKVMMTGPAGKVMLLPEEDPNTDYIMVATGTGIAPYRGFLRRLFVEKTPAAEAYKGTAWLFLGVANSDALLYDDDWQDIISKYPNNFRLDYALSREELNSKGGKMYIQDRVEEYSDDVFRKLDSGAHIYFCGLKGMMPGIQDMLKVQCIKRGLDYDTWLKHLKEKKQWHVEVY